jgi:hypothetical protein
MRYPIRPAACGMALAASLATLGFGPCFANAPARPAAAPNVEFVSPSAEQRAMLARIKTAPASGMRAFRDPVTGLLREATPEDAPSTAKAATARQARVAQTHAAGGLSVALDGKFMSNAVARKHENGRVEFQCVTGDAASPALLSTEAAKEHRHDR